MSPTTEPVSSRFMAVGRFIDTRVTSHCIKRTGYALGEKGRGRVEGREKKIVALSEKKRERGRVNRTRNGKRERERNRERESRRVADR